jgi:hypothetical protein
MATNFTIRRHRREDGLHIKLSGDFDGSSAFELNHCLMDLLDANRRIIVHTDRLASLTAFGRDVFHKQFASHPQTTGQVVFTGTYAPDIAPEGCAALVRTAGPTDGQRQVVEEGPWRKDRRHAFTIGDR